MLLLFGAFLSNFFVREGNCQNSRRQLFEPYDTSADGISMMLSDTNFSFNNYISLIDLLREDEHIKRACTSAHRMSFNELSISECNINSNINQNGSFAIWDGYLNTKKIEFENSTFQPSLSLSYINSEQTSIVDCKTNGLSIGYFSGGISILNNKIKDVYIDNFNGEFFFNDNTSPSDTLDLRIDNSFLKMCDISVRSKINNYSFSEDTLNSFIGFDYPNLDTCKVNLTFYRCYINSPISISGEKGLATCKFIDCDFGPNASIIAFKGDTLVFQYCTRYVNPLTILIVGGEKKCQLEVYSSDIDKLDFDYLGYIQLVNSSDIIYNQKEQTISNYERLLEKFKKEGKTNSYKNLDLEYTKYRYSQQGRWGKIWNFIDNGFWGYGYKRTRVFLWTAIFILIFWLINLFASKSFPSYYSIGTPSQFKLYRAIRIFLFTSILFFSFTINFEKLKEYNNRFIAWIFFQYSFGLLMLFFILNAVIKLKS